MSWTALWLKLDDTFLTLMCSI